MSAIALLMWCKDGRTDEGEVLIAAETFIVVRIPARGDILEDWEEVRFNRHEDGYFYEMNTSDDPIEIRLVQMGEGKFLVKWDQGNHENCHCHRRVEEITSDDYYDFSGAFRTYKTLRIKEELGEHDVHNVQIMRYQEVDLGGVIAEVENAIQDKKDEIAAEAKKKADAERIRIEAREKEQVSLKSLLLIEI